MNDRELIEMAAKAAEIKGGWDEKDDGWFVPHVGGGWASLTRWDPLEKNSQAFELMVKCNLFIFHGWTYAKGEDTPYANVVVDNAEQTVPSGEIKGGDPYAATRRAIVRAAAAIGKEMQ